MQCPNGHPVEAAAKFCPECGAATDKPPAAATGWDEAERLAAERARKRDAAPAAPVAQAVRPSGQPPPVAGGWFSRKRRLVGVLIGVVLVLAVIGAAQKKDSPSTSTDSTNIVNTPSTTTTPAPTPKKKPRPTRYAQLLPANLTVRKAASASCADMKIVINRWAAADESRTAQLPSHSADVYAVSAFLAKAGTGWVRAQTDTAYESQLGDAAHRNLLRLVGVGKAKLVTDQMDASYERAALNVCGLTATETQLDNKLADLDARAATLIAFAKSKPWYPAGYSQFNANVAFKWDNNVPKCNQNDGIDGSYCWGMLIITRHGCPSSLYAEINIMQGDTVLDFSNDTLGSLSPGQVGELGFQAYENTSGTLDGQLKTIDCY